MRLSKVVLLGIVIFSLIAATPSAMAKDEEKQATDEQKKNCCVAWTKDDEALVTAGAMQAIYIGYIKGSYDRVGKVPHCAPDQDHDAGLCYKKCPDGYKGVGPVCWQHCPEGYKDDGATCRRDVHITKKGSYGRGAGKAQKIDRHLKLHCPGGYPDKDAGLCYENCRDGYHGVGPVCWQDRCPDGYHDDGGTCRRNAHIFGKKSQGRGAGKPPKTCGKDKGYTHLSLSMCYKPARHCFECTGSHCSRILDCDVCSKNGAEMNGVKMPYTSKYLTRCGISQAYADSCEGGKGVYIKGLCSCHGKDLKSVYPDAHTAPKYCKEQKHGLFD